MDSFQNKGLKHISGIKHAYFSRTRNQQVTATANQETRPKNNKEIIKCLTKKLEQQQITLFAHLPRAPEDDEMKQIYQYNPTVKEYGQDIGEWADPGLNGTR